jgi:hypothetical protein
MLLQAEPNVSDSVIDEGRVKIIFYYALDSKHYPLSEYIWMSWTPQLSVLGV